MDALLFLLSEADDPLPWALGSVLSISSLQQLPVIVIIGFLLILSALVSASEVALFSLRPDDLKTLKGSKKPTHQRVLGLIETPKKLLATILIVNNLVNISIVVLSTYILAPFIQSTQSAWVVFFLEVVLITLIILVFGEIIPKVLANKKPLGVAEKVSGLIYMALVATKPISSFLVRSTAFIENKFTPSKNISVDDLSKALELTTENIAHKEDKKILKGIVNFGNTEVSEIMKPRVHVKAIELNTTYEALLQHILENGFSRIPIYQESLDQVKGILYVKDLIPSIDKNKHKWQKLVRMPFFVPENKKIDDLLKEFQDKRIHMAIVVDEYGGTSGIVTLEDVIEEIVGEITDEFDDDDLVYSKIDDNNYVFEGKILLKDLYKVLDIEGNKIDAGKGEADTLAGFVLEQMGRIPQKGEKFKFEHYTFFIESSDKRKVKQVKITIHEA